MARYSRQIQRPRSIRTIATHALESVGIQRGEPVDVSAGRAAGMIEDLRAEVSRLRSELAAAQAGPVVEWRKAEQWEEDDIGRFSIAVSDAGWSVEIKGHSGMYELIDRGPETGPAGKAACLAAYRRAISLSRP